MPALRDDLGDVVVAVKTVKPMPEGGVDCSALRESAISQRGDCLTVLPAYFGRHTSLAGWLGPFRTGPPTILRTLRIRWRGRSPTNRRARQTCRVWERGHRIPADWPSL